MKKSILMPAALAFFASSLVHAQGTAFTYQGRLNTNGIAANGTYDFRFKLYSDALGGTQVGGSYATNGIAVANGLFATTMDFGPGIFTGSNYWLEVDVRTNGASSYALLSPLQALTPLPYAIFASGASNLLGPLPAAQLSGAVANGNLPSSPTVPGTVTAGAFAGNGANLTNVNAATLNGFKATNFWQLGGNAVVPGQFLGSTNNQPVVIRQNNLQVFQITSASNSINGYGANSVGGNAANYVSNGVVGAVIGGGGSPNTWIYSPAGPGVYSSQQAGSNVVSADFGVVPGGAGNWAGGVGSLAMGVYSGAYGFGSLAMGLAVQAQGSASVAMGDGVEALADNSVALGSFCEALHPGSFVWGDSQTTYYNSTGNNQFLIRAGGGVGIGTNAPAGALEVASASGAPQLQLEQQNPDYARIRLHALTNAFWDIAAQSPLNFYSSVYGNVMTLQNNGMVGVSVGNPGHYLDVGGRIRLRQEGVGNTAGLWLYQNGPANDRAFVGMDNDGYMGFWGNQGAAWGLVMNTTNSFVGIANTVPTTYLQVVNATCNGSSWVNASDRNLKQGFAPVDPVEVLAKVVAMPVQSWDYKAQPGEKHIGPVAQDFHAAFGLNGADDKHIATVDESGVALAAIQGLNEKLEARSQRLESENAELKQQLAELKSLVQQLAQSRHQ